MTSGRTIGRARQLAGTVGVLIAAALAPGFESPAPPPVTHESVGKVFKPADVDWVFEGGQAMRIEDGRLILESSPALIPGERSRNHLVCWLRKEVPADFLLEVVLRPRDKRNGLNIIFFSTRGIGGKSIFDSTLARRDGTFVKYHSGDLEGYHVSYWAPPRGTTHIRKNRGFHLAAVSDLDLIAAAPPESFETVRIHKRGEKIRVLVNDRIVVAWDDDGRIFGPAHLHPGRIGLRQMGHTLGAEYDRVALWPLRAEP
jgi:hypothetical protein